MAEKKRRAKGTAASPPVPNGGEVAVPPVRRPNGQLAGQPGSSGGVHRGPDLKPRNVVQAVIMKAFIDDGVVVTGDGTDKKAGWRRKKKVRHAMVHNAARAVQRIFEDAAAGDQAAYGASIRALGLMHEVLQPGKDEGKGGGPFMHRFARAPQAALTPPAEASPADEPGSVVDRQGNVYVDGGA
jgi:hypothetical protein